MYPLKFRPILKTKVWGGEKIAPFKEIKTDLHGIGESWELSDYKGDESVVANGPLAGRNLTELMREYKDLLVGKKVYADTGNEFPLLIKFIDAKEDLSIQVHPDDKMAFERHNSKGKTEMWYVVSTDPGAHLMSGLSKKITPEEYVRRVHDNTFTDVLQDFKVKEGDVFFLPAGRIHSLGTGTFVAEIQQTSDITYRIYDFGRMGLDGKPRELHIEQAKDAIDYNVYPDYKTSYKDAMDEEVELVSCKYFTTSLFTLSKPYDRDLKEVDSFMVVMCLEGSGCLTDTESDDYQYTLDIHQGDTVLIPATSQGVIFSPEDGGRMKFLTSYIK